MAVVVRLVNGMAALVDEGDDADLISQFVWTAAKRASANTENWYAVTYIEGHIVYMHRLLLKAESGQLVDHVNGVTLDNRRDNLRIVNYD